MRKTDAKEEVTDDWWMDEQMKVTNATSINSVPEKNATKPAKEKQDKTKNIKSEKPKATNSNSKSTKDAAKANSAMSKPKTA